MSGPDAVIRLEQIGRDFKHTHAVQDLTVEIYRGDLFGLVGPDGAGKTTTLRLLAGLLGISSGGGTVNGLDLATQAEKIKLQIGYMAQRFSLYANLTVEENLRFFADIYHVARELIPARMDELLTFAGLETFRQRRAEHLSGGMQKKLALACTLIHQPKILLLDEPTTGVDPISRREFWRILTDLHLRGTTIVVSTPYMDEADRCSRVGLMIKGRFVACDSPQRIKQNLHAEVIKIYPEKWEQARDLLLNLPGVLEMQTYGDALHILVDSAEKRLGAVEKYYRKHGISLRSIRTAPVRMEEVFISTIRSMEADSETKSVTESTQEG
ncbi:MAG: ABC transporter ATP-binding protein [Anaerolineales bacterium]|nr:ABC transporter ATP-binding protein [Anaerolineales bacterium]